jgi:hypothetical protein
MRETSLDDFLGGSGDEGDAPTTGEGDGDSEATTDTESGSSHPEDGADGANDPSGEETTAERSPESATATYAWTSVGATCAGCGTTVERRWQDDGRLVCADCKEW